MRRAVSVAALAALVLGSAALAQTTLPGSTPTQVLTGGPSFGSNVALSGDGNTLLVGGGSRTTVFVRSAGAWQAQTRLGAHGLTSLSADGNEALVGRRLFTRSRGSWRLTRTFEPGIATTLSPDGRSAAITVRFGEVDIFSRGGSSWMRTGRLLGSSGTGFGLPTAFSSGGATLLVDDAGAGGAPGVVGVYGHAGSRWVLRASLRQPNSTSVGNGFGFGLGISSSGNTVIAVGSQIGKAYIFTHAGGRWSLRATLSIHGQRVTEVALSGDGHHAVLTGGLTGAPDAYLYVTAGRHWVKKRHLMGPTTARNALVETAPVLSADGSTVALSGPTTGLFGSNKHAPGSVDIFG